MNKIISKSGKQVITITKKQECISINAIEHEGRWSNTVNIFDECLDEVIFQLLQIRKDIHKKDE